MPRSRAPHPIGVLGACRSLTLVVGLVLGGLVALPHAQSAQSIGSGGDPVEAAPATSVVAPGGAGTLAPGVDPLTEPPVTRDATQRPTIRAIALSEGLRLDGRLDEPVYEEVPPLTGFIQQMPVEGGVPSERTEAWILFDDSNVYVAARLSGLRPTGRLGGQRDAARHEPAA